jgi:hypothetical protein
MKTTAAAASIKITFGVISDRTTGFAPAVYQDGRRVSWYQGYSRLSREQALELARDHADKAAAWAGRNGEAVIIEQV